MAETNLNTNKLKINLLTIDQYHSVYDTEDDELYVVNETNDLDDPGNIISSKTYADKGREAVVTQTSEPTSQYTQIWIDPDEEVVYISPANSDMDNITETGSENIVKALTPDLSRATDLSQAAGSYIDLTTSGWIYAYVGGNSSIELKRTNAVGNVILSCTTDEDSKMSDHILLEKNTRLYVNSRSGTVTLTFYPCKGLAT